MSVDLCHVLTMAAVVVDICRVVTLQEVVLSTTAGVSGFSLSHYCTGGVV